MSNACFYYIILKDELCHDMISKAMESLGESDFKNIETITNYRNNLRSVSDITDVNNPVHYVVLKIGFDFANSLKGLHGYTKSGANTKLEEARWQHNNMGTVEQVSPPPTSIKTLTFNGIDERGETAVQIVPTELTVVVKFKASDNGAWASIFGMFGTYPDTFLVKMYGPNGTVYFTSYEAAMVSSNNSQTAGVGIDTYITVVGTLTKTLSEMYINDVKVDSDVLTYSSLNVSNCRYQIGSNSGAGEFLNGDVVFAAVYNKVLTAQQISDLYVVDDVPNIEALDSYIDCIHYWNFGENFVSGVEADIKGTADMTFTNVDATNIVEVV